MNFNTLFVQGSDFIIQVKNTAIIRRIRNVMTNNMEFPVFHLMINRILFHLFKNIDNYFAFVFPVQFLPHSAGILFPAVQQFRIGKDLLYFSGDMFRLMIFNKSSHFILINDLFLFYQPAGQHRNTGMEVFK